MSVIIGRYCVVKMSLQIQYYVAAGVNLCYATARFVHTENYRAIRRDMHSIEVLICSLASFVGKWWVESYHVCSARPFGPMSMPPRNHFVSSGL